MPLLACSIALAVAQLTSATLAQGAKAGPAGSDDTQSAQTVPTSSAATGAPGPPPNGMTTPNAADGTQAPIQEVVVHGRRADPGSQEMTRAEVRQVPGAFGDSFRAIEVLPGVVPLISGAPYFLVRGAPPGNTGFFIDGVRVPALFHLGVGQAVVHPGLIDRVDFYPGGYPARFGRFTGGILAGEVAPTGDRAHEEVSVRLLDAGGLVATPLADGRADVVAAGHYGYPGPLLSLFAPDVGLSYWDYQARAHARITDRDELGVFAFGSFDSLSSRNAISGKMDEVLGIQFHRVDFRWDRRTGGAGMLRVALTLGYDRTAAGQGLGQIGASSSAASSNMEDSVQADTIGVRAEWFDQLSSDVDARIGSDVILQSSHVVVGLTAGTGPGGMGPQTPIPVLGIATSSVTQVDVNGGLFGDLAWRPSPRVELRPGIRLDAFTSRSATGTPLLGSDGSARAVGALDPRLSARWDMTSWLAWVVALGVAHQASNVPLPSPGLQFSQLSRGLQSAFQQSAGAEVKLPFKFTATVDAFVHDYTGLADLYESCPPGDTSCTFDGRAVGMELLVRRRLTERLTGWLSYTLSRSEREAFYQGRWTRTLSQFDRPHVVNLVLAADLGRRWRAGARAIAYSGLPYSTTSGPAGPPNAREPPFVRLDLRLEKKWQALGGTMTLVFEWLNALLSKESFGTECSSAQCKPAEVGPITFPSVGVEQEW